MKHGPSHAGITRPLIPLHTSCSHTAGIEMWSSQRCNVSIVTSYHPYRQYAHCKVCNASKVLYSARIHFIAKVILRLESTLHAESPRSRRAIADVLASCLGD